MITIDIQKARDIAHGIRRGRRAAEFAPHDAVIAGAIPGADAVQAEAARQQIRERYADLQERIDATGRADELAELVRTELLPHVT